MCILVCSLTVENIFFGLYLYLRRLLNVDYLLNLLQLYEMIGILIRYLILNIKLKYRIIIIIIIEK